MAGAGLLVDTSFLISLVHKERDTHHTAREFYQHALKTRTKLFLSSLVVAEFSQRQSIADLGLANYIMAPFNIPDGILAGALAEKIKKDDGIDREAFKVDVMLMAQAEKLHAGIITDDKKTMQRYYKALAGFGDLTGDCILLKEGFDPHRLKDPLAPGLQIPTTEGSA
jgi:predicted nucleic acid-binding protein